MFILRTKDGLTYMQLAWQGAVALFTTRRGGLSEDAYESLNLGLHVGDEKAAVLANRGRLAGILEEPLSQFTGCQQVHGKNIAIVGKEQLGSGSQDLESAILDCDGLLTDERIPLFALFADCVPLWLYDPVKKAGGVIHAGWRGTVAGIGLEAIGKLKSHFGSDPGNILAAIGPSIGPCCYLVGQDVFQAAQKLAGKLQISLDPYFISQGNKSWRADLGGFNRALLMAGGILAGNITTSGFCTSCQPSLFFSHRRDQGKTGRMAAIFLLQEGRR